MTHHIWHVWHGRRYQYMTTLLISEAMKPLYSLIDKVKESHVSIQIVDKRNSAETGHVVAPRVVSGKG